MPSLTMRLLRHIVLGTFLCLLGASRFGAARRGGPGDGGNVFEGEQPTQPTMEDNIASVSPRVITRATAFPFYRPWEGHSEKSSIERDKFPVHDARFDSVTDGTLSKQAKQRRRRLGLGGKEANSHQGYTTGWNYDGATPHSSGSGNAGSVSVFTSVPVSSRGDAVNEFSAARTPQNITVLRSPLASQKSPSGSSDASVEVKDSSVEELEEELLQLVVTAGLFGRLLEEEHYRLLAVKLFTSRAHIFRETFGRFPGDRVFAHFFKSAEEGILEDELQDFSKLKLFVYCLHLEARDMAEGYLFSRKLSEEINPRPRDFEAIMDMLRQVLRDGRLYELLEDEAERYLLYRFYVALQRKTREEGNEEDLELVDKYILSLISAGVLQEELDARDGRQYIIEKLTSRAGVLSGVPLPPPRAPPPPPPPTTSSTAPPPKPKPKPKPKTSTPKPKKSAAVQLNTNICLVSLLTIGAAAASA